MTTAHTKVPGPAGAPLLGSMLDLLRDPLGTYESARRDHGDLVRFTVGPPGLRAEVHAVFSPEGAQQVLATEAAGFRKDNAFYEEVRLSLGNGLLTSQDADYQRQRRLLQPLFTPRRVDGYATAVTTEATALAAAWHAAPDGTVDVLEEMHGLTLRTIARVLFGGAVEPAVETVGRCMPVVNDHVRRRGFAPVRTPRDWPTPGNRRAAAATAELYAVCDEIIERRRAEGGDGQDLLSLLASARDEDGRPLDPAEIRDQVLIFLLAGHETTATSLAFALHLLARHPEAQSRARDEIDRVLGGRVPGAADLDALPHLTAVLKEAMRLYPAAPVIGRRSVAATRIGGLPVPAGADVIVVPWVIHRHPGHWTEPDRFDPGRFTPQAEAARHRYAWLPFGGGPRACIGKHFSLLESVLALAVLLRGHELTAVDQDVPLGAGITLQARGPARCRVTPRARVRPAG
ncbi:cytochrome P450 [Actinacidiphila glaucinigra]|uniref:cytochrome P450 n=1 Tax=Actinacidiphila glaucinigra TaxID=235986 RepID=UPI0035E326C2